MKENFIVENIVKGNTKEVSKEKFNLLLATIIIQKLKKGANNGSD